MLEQARDRAQSLEVADRVSFQAGDARRLPFADGTFDATLVESVNVFFKDKLPVIRGYMRVTRPGGYIGHLEMIWLATPTPETVESYQRTVYADSMELDEWRRLLEDAGPEDVVANAYKLDVRTESRGRIQRYGCNGLMRATVRIISAVFKDQISRQFLGNIFSSVPNDMMKNTGYGVYAGRTA
jgi:ubiquinone/menaquinone biosynthesis C-methylase UbiE